MKTYYYIDTTSEGRFVVYDEIDTSHRLDIARRNYGNYFAKQDVAEKKAQKMNEILLQKEGN